MAKRDEGRGSPRPGQKCSAERTTGGVSRRDFIKGTGVAVSARVLVGEELLKAQAPVAEKVVGPGGVPITLRINGQTKKLTAEPRVTLLDALRDHLNLTGAKKVCDRGSCGSCTVIADGKAVYACTLLAIEAQGRDIVTIEGLAAEDELHTLSAAFVEHDALECGFCIPGFVVACKAYIDRNPNPTEAQVKRALGGNLCRCGAYMGVRKAVVDAAMKMKGGRA